MVTLTMYVWRLLLCVRVVGQRHWLFPPAVGSVAKLAVFPLNLEVLFDI